MSKPLFQLTNEFLALLDMADTGDEADQQAFIDTLESLAGDIKDKVISCACVCKSLEHQADVIESEEKRLAARRKSVEGNIKRLKDSMQKGMEAAQLRQVKSNLLTVTIQKNQPKVILDESVPPEKMPKEFTRTEVLASRQAIGEALKAGQKLDFAFLETSESIRIR